MVPGPQQIGLLSHFEPFRIEESVVVVVVVVVIVVVVGGFVVIRVFLVRRITVTLSFPV